MTSASTPLLIAPPCKILLANFGRIGDCIITTAVIRAIHETHPEIVIDVVCGSWARELFAGLPQVRRVHALDHYLSDRSSRAGLGKVFRYLAALRALVPVLRQEHYDLSVDVRSFLGNSHFLTWLARIPVQVGFDRFPGFLLTHRSPPCRYSREHEAKLQLELLVFAGLLPEREVQALRYDIGKSEYSLPATLEGLGDYLVFHPVSGHPRKNWAPEKWRALLQRVSAQGATVVLTGSADDAPTLSQICAGIERSHNLAGKLTWAELVATLKSARKIVSADTVTAHLAGALEVPVLTVFSGVVSSERWRPLGEHTAVISHPVPCAPCCNYRGCAAMTCIRELSVEAVFQALEGLPGVMNGRQDERAATQS